jgi:hypothetical protein
MKLERESGDLLITTARNGWIIYRHEGHGLSSIPWIAATREELAKIVTGNADKTQEEVQTND